MRVLTTTSQANLDLEYLYTFPRYISVPDSGNDAMMQRRLCTFCNTYTLIHSSKQDGGYNSINIK